MAHFVGLDVSVKETAVCASSMRVARYYTSRRCRSSRTTSSRCDVDRPGLWPRRDRGRTTVAVAGQRHGGSRFARDLRRDPSHEVAAEGAADQQIRAARCAWH